MSTQPSLFTALRLLALGVGLAVFGLGALPATAQEITPTLAAPALPVAAPTAPTAADSPLRLNINLEGTDRPADLSVSVQLVLLMTLLSVGPSLVLLMTSFTRIVIVLGFVRTALGVPSAPSNQIIIGLSLFMTFFIMGPTFDRMNSEALKPFLAKEITSTEAFDRGSAPLRDFMLKQTRTGNLEYFLQLGGYGPTAVKDLPMRVVIPSFVLSELQSAFQMGFLIFLPFLVIDFLVAAVLMSLGMMMMPPNVVSLPFKLLLFVLVDGWRLIVQSLVQSFA
ncbi:Flagellar biosynthetic protein FliP precursor [Lacunisphaera limnophila]|uniref:Flagellar biosynthetic protein FliP n=1 Tax=Lacunisphaera limnophila TaxID=1838286 RepID=A0A1D8AW59_9BACT|nr:flagellar type III secretion system pore protein FliP [Lacunisphaera limnophila]AOS45121.1 Flagellar biosynthetic protein FliP precursor [Lacunisphaera limnophila]